ncbi:Ig-like domain-containing protein, partial [Verrucomicrobia bacterium]|nr:Ig-like domain-containing protein [Verrucomicrobiota bacterium]
MHGTAVIDPASGAWSYIPNPDFHGQDNFQVTLTDDLGGQQGQEITLTVNSVDDPPVISGDIQVEGNEDTIFGGTLQATDPDGLTDGTLFTLAVAAVNGTAAIDPASGVWSYNPNNHFHGPDSFEVTLTDDLGGQQNQEITLTVNSVDDSPVALDDAYTVEEDGSLTVPSGNGVLANDSLGGDGGTLVVRSNTPPSNGILTLNSDGSLTYVPDPDFIGIDSFNYSIMDIDGTSSTATVTITIHPLNDPPVIIGAGLTREYPTGESVPVVDASLDIGDVDDVFLESATLSLTGNDVPSGDVLTFTGVGPAILGSVDTGGEATIVTFFSNSNSNTAFVAATYAGLQIIDVKDPTNPGILGSIETQGSAGGVALSSDGTTAFVAATYAGLQIIDVSDPANPGILGSVETLGPAWEVVLSSDGDTAFVAINSVGLQVIDVSNLANPAILGSVETPGSAFGVALSADGNTAFVADGSADLQVIDVNNPTNPAILGSVETPGADNGITFFTDDDTAFVANGDVGIQIIDVSNRAEPGILGSFDTDGYALNVALSSDGNTAYVADNVAGLQVIDVSDPATPAILGSVDTPGNARGVALSSDGTTAFVADRDAGLQIIHLPGFIVASWDADLATLTLSGRATL